MRKIIIFLKLMLLATVTLAEGPLFSHKDTVTQQEFENVYQNIRGKFGRLLQVIYSHSATDFTTTSATYQNTNLSATIIPSNTSSKILIYVTGIMGIAGSNKSALLSLARGTTELGTAATPGFAQLNGQSIGTFIVAPASIVFVDSPASTSALTYSVRLRCNDGVTTANFGNGLDQSMILVEIGQ